MDKREILNACKKEMEGDLQFYGEGPIVLDMDIVADLAEWEKMGQPITLDLACANDWIACCVDTSRGRYYVFSLGFTSPVTARLVESFTSFWADGKWAITTPNYDGKSVHLYMHVESH